MIINFYLSILMQWCKLRNNLFVISIINYLIALLINNKNWKNNLIYQMLNYLLSVIFNLNLSHLHVMNFWLIILAWILYALA